MITTVSDSFLPVSLGEDSEVRVVTRRGRKGRCLPAEFRVETVDEVVVEGGLVGPPAYPGPVLLLAFGGASLRGLSLPAAARLLPSAGGVGQGRALGGDAPAGPGVGVALG